MLKPAASPHTQRRRVLDSGILWDFFDQVEVANFEIASDAFSSFKDLLTRHKGAVAGFLADHYQEFFDHFYRLLQSSNYVTRRQSLKVRVIVCRGLLAAELVLPQKRRLLPGWLLCTPGPLAGSLTPSHTHSSWASCSGQSVNRASYTSCRWPLRFSYPPFPPSAAGRAASGRH